MTGTVRDAVLGVDVGTQGVRAVAVLLDGTPVASASARLTQDVRDGVRHEQSPTEWWHATVAVLRDLTAALPADVTLLGAGLDATSGTVVVEDADGLPVGAALMYDDGRAVSQHLRVDAAGRELWAALGYRMQPTWALPRVLWLLDEDAVPAGGRFAHQGDHLLGRLAGGPVPTDTSTALKTGVDLRTATWPSDVLADLGLSTASLPEVVLPGRPIGAVSREAAAATGLPSGLPLVAGMTDGCAAQVATAALRHGRWSSALGTTLVLKGSSPELVRDPGGAVYCHRHPDGGWLPGGASNSGAGALAAAFPDPAALPGLTRAAAALQPSADPVYAVVGTGERFPFVAPQAHPFGPHTAGAQRFCDVCHAVAYVERLAYDVLDVLGADVSGQVAFSGGGARNDWWNQLRCDLLGREAVALDAADAAAGSAVLAAAAALRSSVTEAAERMVRVRASYTPDPERGAALRPGYERLVGELAARGWLDERVAAAALAVGAVR